MFFALHSHFNSSWPLGVWLLRRHLNSIVFWICTFWDWHPLKFHLIPISSPSVTEFYFAQSRVSSQSVSLHRSVTSFKFHCVELRNNFIKKGDLQICDFHRIRLFQCKSVSVFHSWVSFTADLVSLPWSAFGIQASEFALCLNLPPLLIGHVSTIADCTETLWGWWC